ncbi:MAG: ATP-binding protein [Candidatus Odinarchaeota archaeon]|nr:ATP-binding protein [Candidatus Odinarchaeota archaeon]
MIVKDTMKKLIVEYQQLMLPELTKRDTYFSPMETNKIISIIGPRRSGKTYFMYQVMKELRAKGIPQEKVLYMNLEDSRLYPMKQGFLDFMMECFYELYPENIDTEIFLFLDEIQNVKFWEKFVRRISENKKVKVFITGSSSKVLSREIATSLRGRTLTHVILPFSFKEVLRAKGIQINNNVIYGKDRFMIKKWFDEFLEFGGFPEIVHEKNKNIRIRILQEYLNVMMYRDIVERYNVRNLRLLKLIIKYILNNTGTYFSISSVYKAVKQSISASKATISEYISYLQGIMLMFLLPNYAYSLKEAERVPKKVYVIDTGLRNANTFIYTEDLGRLLENIVFLELFRDTLRDPQKKIYYLKENKNFEVDFLVTKKNEITEIYQVAWDVTKESTRVREEKSLVAALKKFGLEEGVILTEDFTDEKYIDNKLVKYIPTWIWLITK